MPIKMDSPETLSKVLEEYNNNTKIFTVTTKENSPEQMLLQSGQFTNSYCCPFCGSIRMIDKWEQRWHTWQRCLKAAFETWGSIVVQEVMEYEGQWVDWLHGHKFWIIPKRIFMISIRNGLVYPVSPADCKAYHEIHNMTPTPSEPLVEYADPATVFAFFKIHHPVWGRSIRFLT